MEIIKTDELNKAFVLLRTQTVLHSGGIVVLPTDTVYGIVGNADCEEVIEKIFLLKDRRKSKACSIFVKDIATARRYAYISDDQARFLEKLWPGQFIVVFHHKKKLPKSLTGNLDTIGIRIPKHDLLLNLLRHLDFPLVQTSANISGRGPAKNVSQVREYFVSSAMQPDLVVDEGELYGTPSAVVDFTRDRPVLIRMSAVSREGLDKIFKSVDM